VFSLGSYLLLVVLVPVFLALSLLLDLRVLIIPATLVTLDSVFFKSPQDVKSKLIETKGVFLHLAKVI